WPRRGGPPGSPPKLAVGLRARTVSKSLNAGAINAGGNLGQPMPAMTPAMPDRHSPIMARN
ncbi:MAG: hypothetical protein K2K99_02715, partial [Muribaculaceae bacterium]|nr:hypothetical protein [Muribaculaceae bacterium]